MLPRDRWTLYGIAPLDPIWYCAAGLATSVVLYYYYHLSEERRADKSVKQDFLLKALKNMVRTYEGVADAVIDKDEDRGIKMLKELGIAVDMAKGIISAVES